MSENQNAWCVLYVLPYAWTALNEDALLAVAYALHACSDTPVPAHVAWLHMRVAQTRADGLGALAPVGAWTRGGAAEACRVSLARVEPAVPARVACAPRAPRATWWNHTCVSDAQWMPAVADAFVPTAWRAFLDDEIGFRTAPPSVHVPVAYAHGALALALVLVVLWLTAWVPRVCAPRAPPAPPPLAFLDAPADDSSAVMVETQQLMRGHACISDVPLEAL